MPRKTTFLHLSVGAGGLLCLTAPTRSQTLPIPAKKFVAITHISVVDVKAGHLMLDQTVILSGERIVRVLPAGKAKTPPNATVIQGKGLFLMPGLFDAHVHLNNPEQDAKMLIANGVTFVRDMGGNLAERIAERRQARRGTFYGLEMACVGTILDGNPPYHAWSRACGTPEEGRAAVRESWAAGVDQIKVYSLLKPEVHRAICDEAKKLGLSVVGHVPDSMTLEEAVAAGQKGVEHLSRYASLLSTLLPDFKPVPGAFDGGIWERYPDVDKAQLRIRLRGLATAGSVQCPTLVLQAGQARILDQPTRALWQLYALPDDRRGWSEIPAQYALYGRSQAAAFPYLQQTVAELHRAGVPLLIGTDLANPGVLAGFSVHTEMQLWQQAGLRPVEILRAATLVPARFLGVEARLGTVAPGKTASLALTRKNPLQDIRNAAEIEAVFARGRYFDRKALDRLLAEARENVLARSPDLSRTARLELPGKVVMRGRYNLFYGQYGDGAEEFLITKDGGLYRFMALRRQPGFGRYPILQTGQWTLDSALVEGAFEPFVLLPAMQSYHTNQGEIYVASTRRGKFLRESKMLFLHRAALRSPLLAADFFLFQHLEMNVGETRNINTVLFGMSGALPERQNVNFTRLADEDVNLSPNSTLVCRHYTMSGTGGSASHTEVWVNSQGVPVKQVISEGALKRSAILDPSLLLKP